MRATEPPPGRVPFVVASVPAGVLCILGTGSVGEWLAHRYAMHRGRRFPPDRYVHTGRIEYPSTLRLELDPAELERWPSYERARERVHVPHSLPSGVGARLGGTAAGTMP